MEEWKKYKLKDCVEMQKGFAFKSSDYINNGIKIIKVSNLNQNRFDDNSCVFISPISAELYSRYSLVEDDIIISTVGSWPTNPESVVGKVCRVPKIINGSLLNQNAVRLRVKNNFNQRFLYYILSGSNFSSYIANTAQGSANQASITLEDIRSFEFISPSIEGQEEIVSILKSLDDKIEVNRRINEQLEELAQALFKSWFVDFEPFKDGEFVESELGMIPEGWKVGTLGELIEIKYGKDHKKLNDGDIPVYGSGGIMRYVDKSLYEGESVLIPRKGTLNNVMYVNRDFWTVDTMFFSKMKISNIAIFVYLFLSKKDLASMNSGSAVPSMTVDILNRIQLVIPSDKAFEDYNNIVSSLFAQMSNNSEEITHLTNLRDTLLPKLMSGEIDVEQFNVIE